MHLPKTDIDEIKIIQLAKKFKVKELYLFGSVLREDFNEDSDIDFLVVFEQNAHFSYFEILDFKEKLEEILNRRVDLAVYVKIDVAFNFMRFSYNYLFLRKFLPLLSIF